MSDWLRLLLGLGPEEVPPGGVTRFEFAGMPHGPWAVIAFIILVLAVALIVLLYRRETEVGRLRKSVLASLRLLALALVVLVILNPRLAVEIQARRPARTILLVDGSGSMASWTGTSAARPSRSAGIGARCPPAGTGGLVRRRLPGGARGGRDRAERSRGEAREVEPAERVRLRRGRRGVRSRGAPRDRAEGRRGGEGHLDRVRPPRRPRSRRAGAGRGRGPPLRRALERRRLPLGAKAELASRGIPLHAVGVGKLETRKNIAIEELTAPEVAEAGFRSASACGSAGTAIRGMSS